jgi:hypothetical protein
LAQRCFQINSRSIPYLLPVSFHEQLLPGQTQLPYRLLKSVFNVLRALKAVRTKRRETWFGIAEPVQHESSDSTQKSQVPEASPVVTAHK